MAGDLAGRVRRRYALDKGTLIMITIYQRNGSKLERAFKVPPEWLEGRNWPEDPVPFEMVLPDVATDQPQRTCTLELLWHNGAPHNVVTKGAENLESHPMVDILEEGN